MSQVFTLVLFSELGELRTQESVRLCELIRQLLLNRVLLPKKRDNKSDFLPKGQALVQTLVKLPSRQAELLVDALGCLLASLESGPQKHGLE